MRMVDAIDFVRDHIDVGPDRDLSVGQSRMSDGLEIIFTSPPRRNVDDHSAPFSPTMMTEYIPLIELKCIDSIDLLYKIHDLMMRNACHEEEEWLTVDGKRYFDPHAGEK